MRRKRSSQGSLKVSSDTEAIKRAQQYLTKNNFVKFKNVSVKLANDRYFVNFSGFCPIHKREHKGNHFYVIVPVSGSDEKFACHNTEKADTPEQVTQFTTELITEDYESYGVRHPLPDFNSAKGFEWNAFMHLKRMADMKFTNAPQAVSDYVNCHAVYIKDVDSILVHWGKKTAVLYPVNEFDKCLDKWWRDRTTLKNFRCNSELPHVKNDTLYMSNSIAIWIDVDLPTF